MYIGIESVHEGEKHIILDSFHNNKCGICGVSFVQKFSVKRHIESVDEGKNHLNVVFVIYPFSLIEASFKKPHHISSCLLQFMKERKKNATFVLFL